MSRRLAVALSVLVVPLFTLQANAQPITPDVPEVELPKTPTTPETKAPAGAAAKSPFKAKKVPFKARKTSKAAVKPVNTEATEAAPKEPEAQESESAESAEPEESNAPEQPAPSAEAAPELAEPASPTGSSRDWLAQPQQPTPLAQDSSAPLGTWALFGLLAVGGVAFWYQQRKKKERVAKQLGQAELLVLASSRIGPKAHAVAVEFGGRVLVLGVTDSNVSCLQTLQREDLLPAQTGGSELVNSIGGSQVSPGHAARFKTYLDDNMTADDASPAAQLAHATADRTTFGGRARPAEDLVNIEGQAAGLAARLGKRSL